MLPGGVQSVCIYVYLELGEPLCDAAYLDILQYVHHATLKCENSRNLIVKSLGIPTKQSP